MKQQGAIRVPFGDGSGREVYAMPTQAPTYAVGDVYLDETAPSGRRVLIERAYTERLGAYFSVLIDGREIACDYTLVGAVRASGWWNEETAA